jgi:hypothetical protein
MGGQLQVYRACAAVFGSLLLSTATLLAEPPAQQPLIPEQAVVVLMTGLPGDMESENTYREQLQTWVELVASGGKAAKLFVLCDDPASVTLPPKPEGKVLKADRNGFLDLGRTLAGVTNPLVLVAWGHGGRQGNTNVFHVRGPRITAADFKALADQASAPESRWLLMFRGSGSFASQLAGEKRQVLASECETMFTSDPVGMAVLLKLLRDKPALSFEALSEQFGRATAAWYAERSLARTEEPALWAGTAAPRLLAGGSDTNSFAAVQVESTNVPPARKDSTAAVVQGELPGAWKTLKRVEPQEYPDADGVMLRRRCNYTLGSSPAVVVEQEEFIQILTPEGKRFGDFDVSYSPPQEDIEFLDCEVLRADGKLVRLDPDAIREGGEQAVGDYHQGRRKFFSLPGVGPGAVVHVRYKTEWKKFPLPHVSLEAPIGQEQPTVETTVEVGVPKGTPFHFALEQISAADPVIKQTSYGTTYLWRFEDVPPQSREILAPPGQHSRLLISTFPDWAAFAEWYDRISKLTDEVTPEIAAKAEELTRDAKSERERVLALYNYVTGLRYVAVPMGVNSFRPHAAANVLQNQFGDCKDKANLFNALLHSLKIEARLVLVPRFTQTHEGLPGLSFNHAISRVTLNGETMWVDTTDDVCRFGMLPPGDPGRKVLVIDGQTSALTQLPAPDPKAHCLALRGEVDCTGATDALPVTLSATALGLPDYELRATSRELKSHAFSLPLLAASFRPAAGSFALESQKGSAVSSLEESFTWKADGTWVGGCSTNGGLGWLHAPFWLPKEWEVALHHRKAGLFLNQGYPLTLEEEFVFALLAKAQPQSLPGVRENKTEPLRWRVEWVTIEDGKLAARLHAELARGELAAADVPRLQQQLRELLAALAVSASWTLPP